MSVTSKGKPKTDLHARIRKAHKKILAKDSEKLFDVPNIYQLILKAQRLESLLKRGYELPLVPSISGPSVAYKFSLTDAQFDIFERFRRRYRIEEMGHVPDAIIALYSACEQIYDMEELFNAPIVSRTPDTQSRTKKKTKAKKR